MVPTNKKEEYWLWYLLLPLFIFFSFYYALGSYPLFDNNEGLYASIAKQMLLHHDFIIPHLNSVPYIEKPPLLYWLLSLSFSLFGFTAFAARLITASSAALLCMALISFTNKLKQPQLGIISSVILASSIGVSIIARMVYFDMVFTLLISCTLFCLFYWHETRKKPILRISYLFFGLAILTKGLIAGVLIGGSFGLFLILEKDFRSLYQALDPIGITVFLAVVLPWHLAATIQHRGFAWHYFITEHFLRFLNQREPHDYYHGTIFYYLPRIMIYLLPWSLFMPLLFWRTKNMQPPEQKLLRFCWCWLLLPLLFFSLSSAKANYYMIVSMPALAMILSTKMKNLRLYHHGKIFAIWAAVILLGFALAISAVLIISNLPQLIACKPWLLTVIIYGLVTSIAILTVVRQPKIITLLIAGLIIPLVLTMVTYIKANVEELSAASVGLFLAENAKNQPLYLYQDFENISALSFYAPADFKMVDTKSNDLYYGAHLPQFKPWFIDQKELSQETLTKQAYIVVPTKKLLTFYQSMSGIKFSLLKKTARLVVLSRNRTKNEARHEAA